MLYSQTSTFSGFGPAEQINGNVLLAFDANLQKFRPLNVSDLVLSPTQIASSGFTNVFTPFTGSQAVFQILGYNNYTGTQYLQLYYGNSPISGQMFALEAVAAQNNFYLDFDNNGAYIPSGLTCFLSSSPTSIVSGVASGFFTVVYN